MGGRKYLPSLVLHSFGQIRQEGDEWANGPETLCKRGHDRESQFWGVVSVDLGAELLIG